MGNSSSTSSRTSPTPPQQHDSQSNCPEHDPHEISPVDTHELKEIMVHGAAQWAQGPEVMDKRSYAPPQQIDPGLSPPGEVTLDKGVRKHASRGRFQALGFAPNQMEDHDAHVTHAMERKEMGKESKENEEIKEIEEAKKFPRAAMQIGAARVLQVAGAPLPSSMTASEIVQNQTPMKFHPWMPMN
jgi:hypothetical protein